MFWWFWGPEKWTQSLRVEANIQNLVGLTRLIAMFFSWMKYPKEN